jgi:xanthine dehydrogenase YagS FAD-binding subunit
MAAARFIAGGTNLLDLMKENGGAAGRLIDITHLSLRASESTNNGGVRIGALVSNTDVA